MPVRKGQFFFPYGKELRWSTRRRGEETFAVNVPPDKGTQKMNIIVKLLLHYFFLIALESIGNSGCRYYLLGIVSLTKLLSKKITYNFQRTWQSPNIDVFDLIMWTSPWEVYPDRQIPADGPPRKSGSGDSVPAGRPVTSGRAPDAAPRPLRQTIQLRNAPVQLGEPCEMRVYPADKSEAGTWRHRPSTVPAATRQPIIPLNSASAILLFSITQYTTIAIPDYCPLALSCAICRARQTKGLLPRPSSTVAAVNASRVSVLRGRDPRESWGNFPSWKLNSFFPLSPRQRWPPHCWGGSCTLAFRIVIPRLLTRTKYCRMSHTWSPCVNAKGLRIEDHNPKTSGPEGTRLRLRKVWCERWLGHN